MGGERAPKINEILMPERNKHPLKNWRFLTSKSSKNVKKSSPKRNYVFFDHIFEWILRGFGEGFGELLGEVWEGFGSS